MPLDDARLIRVVTDALLRDLGDEVEVVFRFGSRVKGGAHRYSDVDVSFVPAREAAWHAITVLVDDVLCDLFPLPWPTLERWAAFDDVRGSLLLDAEVVFARSDAADARFRALADRLRALTEPAARPEMLAKAQAILARAGDPLVLLREEAAAGRMLPAVRQARRVLDTVLHCLAVLNQAPVDTRRLPEVVALPRLPDGFETGVAALRSARDPAALVASAEALVRSTRALLLAEQRTVQRRSTTFAEAFAGGYPELRADLQHVLLACERGQASALDVVSPLDVVSVLHEVMVGIASAETGVEYGSSNAMRDYWVDLDALGFPDLLAPALAGDRTELHRRTVAFDERLRDFLVERGVDLASYGSIDELEAALAERGRPGAG